LFCGELTGRQQRHCERSEAIHLTTERKNGLLRRFAPRNDGVAERSLTSRLLALGGSLLLFGSCLLGRFFPARYSPTFFDECPATATALGARLWIGVLTRRM
jgi:hypothetical protein